MTSGRVAAVLRTSWESKPCGHLFVHRKLPLHYSGSTSVKMCHHTQLVLLLVDRTEYPYPHPSNIPSLLLLALGTRIRLCYPRHSLRLARQISPQIRSLANIVGLG